jgi:tRNA-Thr(GGU) m(6)t(6)A37 methyltransferase TsaA
MEIHPVAYFESPLKSKFGIPRQSGLVNELTGRIVFEPAFRKMEAVRGLEDFDYLWLIWEFSANHQAQDSKQNAQSLTVRPPRLGGNVRLGVFATRSPFRPNGLGLSCVRLDRVEEDAKLGPVIYVKGADLMDGTPIYDVKPYVAYADAHPEARSGFVDTTAWEPLQVVIPDGVATCIPQEHLEALKATLAQDPRPRYHDDPERVYGMPYLDWDIRFKVEENVLTVVECVKI